MTGCSTPEEISVNGVIDDDAMKELEVVAITKGMDYMLWSDEDAVKVGDPEQEALASSGEPSKSFRIRSLPASFDKEEFSTEGWEKDDDAFACIFYKDKTVLAMYIRDNVDDSDIVEAIELYQDKYGSATATYAERKSIQFHYWYTTERMLMISTAIDIEDRKSITIAIGVPEVMKHLGMDPLTAQNDIDKAGQNLTTQKAEE